MKKLILIVIAISVVGMAGAVMAASTVTVTVSATVVETCKFYSTGSINFNLNPLVGGNASGSITSPIVFSCTKGTTYTITDDNGQYEEGEQHRLKHATSDEYIPYSFDYTPKSGTGKGHGDNKRVTLNITSEVQADHYLDMPAGEYSDIVTLTINF